TECFAVAPATIDIEKVANPAGPVSAGTAIGFDITVTNSGTNTTLGVSVSDNLPSGVDWTLGATSGSTVGLSCSITGSVGSEVLGCTKPSLAAGASFSVRVTANTDATDCGVINNTANVSTSNDGTDSDPASVTVQCPDIQVTKTPDGATVDAGGTITWSIKVENLGPGAATGVVLTDTLPSGITWSESEADCSIAAGPPQVLTCNVGALASGASRTYQVSGSTTKDNCGPVNNTASATATNEPSNVLANNSDSGLVTVLCATVTIGKTADAASVSAGSQIGFTLTWGNSTGGTATGVVVTDNLPGTAGLNWSIAGSTGTGSTCAITGAIGSQVLTCNVGTIAGNTAVSGTVHVVSGTTAATCGTVNNTGHITTTNDGSAQAGASVLVLCPDVHVDKTADTGTINAGDLASFTITVSNAGPGVATSVSLTDTLPAGVAWSEDSASCSITAGVLSCNFGDLAAGASASVTVSGTTDAADCAGLNNTALVAATNEPVADQSDNSDSASIVVNCPDVHVDKTAGNGTISAGDVASFTITATNAGPGIARSVTVTDTLPAGITWSDDSASCSIAAGVLSCNFGDLAAGASASVTVTGTTDAADCGTLLNTALVAATNESVADQADNSDSASIVVNCPDLSVEKTADDGTISAGDVAAFTIVITNHGLGSADDVHVADTLPSGVTWTLDPAVTGCTIVGTALTCDFEELIPGQVVTLHISGATVAANCGTLHNEVTVSASNEPSNLLTDNSDSADIVVDCPTIVLTKTADAGTINAGDPIGFTIEVSNTGLGNATGVHVTDDLPAGITWTADAPTGTASATCSINTAPNPDVLTCDAALMGPGTSFSVHIHGTTTAANCGLVDNEAVVTTTNDGGDDDDAQVMVECPDVTVVKTPDGGVVNAGQNAVFTIVVSNSNAEGTGTAYDVTLTDDLPAGYVWTLGGADAASCSIDTVPSPDLLSCDFGDLEPGASRSITLTAPTNGDNCAVIPNVATVAATNEAQSRTGNNSDSASIDVTCPDIEVIKDAENTPIQVGEDLVFTITVTNIGDGVAEDVILTDNLPAGFDWDVDDERCAIAAGVLTCDFGDMEPLDSVTITLTAPTSDDPEDGNIDCEESLTHRILNVASATAGNEGQGLLENNSDDAVIDVNCSELFIDKTLADTGATDPDLNVPLAEIGDTLNYSLAYDGAGLLTNAVITDVLPQGLDFVEGSPCTVATDPLPCDTDDPYFDFVGYNEATRTLTWTAATLPDPAAGTVTYDVIVLESAPEFAQPLVNVATIDSDQTPPDSDTASVAVLAPPLELTPPPTSTITPQTGTSNPGFALMLILLGVAGLTLGIGFVTPVPASVRRRERLG
ncbi:MAG TPA: hypothetical protein VFK35_02655, partial [Candidatus Limnocylindrales bacterium]|nr:hypothetical protein [Candidatus Limnocylindrales bacterium]